MVREVECPYCHDKVIFEERFSMGLFLALIILGIVPFILNMIGGYFLLDAFLLLSKLGAVPPILGIITIIPEATLLFTSSALLAISYFILSLVLGLIPAIVYLAIRHGSYKCPTCHMPVG